MDSIINGFIYIIIYVYIYIYISISNYGSARIFFMKSEWISMIFIDGILIGCISRGNYVSQNEHVLLLYKLL